MTAGISWSGGKDGWLALLRARESGLDVRYALTMFDESGARSRSHALPPALLARQARALGLAPVMACAPWQDYEARLIDALHGLARGGVDAVVFGDIDIPAHRAFEERVCAAAGLTAVLPLWQQDRPGLLDEMFARGLEAVVVTTDDRYLDGGFCGRRFDRAFVAALPDAVDCCGENGEFHTFVTGGAGFTETLPVQAGAAYPHAVTFGGRAAGYHFAPLSAALETVP
ncbi:MAG TPA: ATP-binding protein [Pseudolabrys sp.]|nr:ATP-binding protein [Pseudolabrys sp.]